MPKTKPTPTIKFPKSFKPYACDGDTFSIKVGDITYTVRIVYDDENGPPTYQFSLGN